MFTPSVGRVGDYMGSFVCSTVTMQQQTAASNLAVRELSIYSIPITGTMLLW